MVDSGQLSSGQGLMAIEAARLADEGLEVSQIVARLEEMKDHVYTRFITDTLDYLVRQNQVPEPQPTADREHSNSCSLRIMLTTRLSQNTKTQAHNALTSTFFSSIVLFV